MVITTRVEPAGPSARTIEIESATPFPSGQVLYERRHMVARRVTPESGWILYAGLSSLDVEKSADAGFGFENRRVVGGCKAESDLHQAAASAAGSVVPSIQFVI